MPYKLNPYHRGPIFDRLDYYEKNTGGGGAGQISNLSLIFCEEFTGDGGTTVFTLTGALENATFDTGSWLIPQIANTLPSHATNDSNKALYDSSNIFTKNRIQVVSIDGGTANVTLSHPPKLLETFKIWYWYTLKQTDILSSYYREEFVASMEGDISSGDIIAAQNVALNTTNFDDILSNADDTVQKAMDTLDDHTHTGLPIDPETHRLLDQLVHELDENHYQEYTYSGWRIDSCIVWNSVSKSVKIREFLYTYSGIRVQTEVMNQYDGTGTLVETLTFSYTYTGPRITSVDCVRS